MAAGGTAGSEHPLIVPDLPSLFPALPTGAWKEPSHQAVAIRVNASGKEGRAAVLIAGLSPFRLFDDSYRGFLGLVAGQISAALGNAQAYEEERRRAEALAELDRAKTTFFSNVSHEFRTPLMLMLSPIEEALSDTAEPFSPGAARAPQLVERNGLRMLRLVNSLLDFARIEAGRVQAAYVPTDLAPYTADLASLFRSAVGSAGLRIGGRLPDPGVPDAYVDRDMWEKIVLNLLSNAFKYTFEGQHLALGCIGRADSVRLTVSGHGHGHPGSRDRRGVFERFHRIEGARGQNVTKVPVSGWRWCRN